ncbi:MAG: multicopper oxidase domain-containing protein [Anaerolineales bacterium]|nr:multicopper oxidase domain-containing protein [Anaerolineales bacterium]MCB8940191.1 multicopper oxidase domain-containing protein [Ardenticatenaceae bacterium]
MTNFFTLMQNRRRRGVAFLMLIIAIGVVLYSVVQVEADGPGVVPSTGMICTENATSTFTLTAKEGYINLTDGNVVYMWSYADGQDDFQYPGPILCVNEGDTVTIVLHNELPEDTSIVFPGQMDVLANGVPIEPQFNGAGELVSMANIATAVGGSVTYEFVAEEPGTYVYQSGTNPGVQTQMGLFGGLVIRPALGPDYAYNNPDTKFNPDTEYIMMLSEIDPLMHQAIERGETFNMADYNARYFLINGRTFPDTIAPNNASWLPAQPYSSLAYIHPYDEIANPDPAIDRFIGMGVEGYPFHPHAFNARVVARDGRVVEGPNGENMAEERFSIPVNPGQTADSLFEWTDIYGWDGQGSPLPVELPSDQNMPAGLFYGSPFLGNQDTVPVGVHSVNQCGEFYHIAHNHALQQITGWGVVLVGQVTFTRIDPPLPNNCQ